MDYKKVLEQYYLDGIDKDVSLVDDAIMTLEQHFSYIDGDTLLHHSRPLAVAYLALREVADKNAGDKHNSQREDIHGAWLVHGEAPWFVRECSECHTKWFFTNGDPVAKYCSECGACMDKPQIFCEDYGTKGDI